MKKITLIYFFLIFIAFSCSKDEPNEALKEDPKEEKIFTRPVGKYVAEIKACNIKFMTRDTLKFLEFEYDANRYVKKIKYYDFIKRQLERSNEFFYNSVGQVNQIDCYNGNSILQTQEFLTYEHQKLASSEVYKIEFDKKTLNSKYQYVTDTAGRVVEVVEYELKEGSLVKKTAIRKYTYNSSGNVKKDFWQDGTYQRIAELSFDANKNPFYDLCLPYSYNALPYFFVIYTLSPNNFTGYNSTIVGPDDMIPSTSYVKVDFKYQDKYPIVMDNAYFFKYIDLK